jgi:hypothetical protein
MRAMIVPQKRKTSSNRREGPYMHPFWNENVIFVEIWARIGYNTYGPMG